MAISLYAVQASGGKILQLDDQSVVNDVTALDRSGGVAFTASILQAPFAASAYAKLRRLIQTVRHEGTATATFTPWRDGSDTGEMITRPLVAGANDTVTVPFNVTGSEFQVAIVVSSFSAPVALGSGELTVIPRRTQR